jgi:hypothetical protein
LDITELIKIWEKRKNMGFWGKSSFFSHKLLISSGAKEQKSRNLIGG